MRHAEKVEENNRKSKISSGTPRGRTRTSRSTGKEPEKLSREVQELKKSTRNRIRITKMY